MRISYTHRFVLIRVQRAASTSIRWAVDPYSDAYDAPTHSKGMELRSDLGEIYDKFITFTFIRNPWDRLVSYYHYWIRKDKDSLHQRVMKSFESFAEYLTHLMQQDYLPIPQDDLAVYKFYYNPLPSPDPQIDYVVDNNDKFIVDFIGRFENLAEDFCYICNILGLNVELPEHNISAHDDYKSYFNDQQRKYVENLYKRELEVFNYTFDNSSTVDVYKSPYVRLIEKGMNAQGLGDLHEAEKAYKDALKRDPENVVTLTRLGTVYFDLQRNAEALEQFIQIVRLNPNALDGWCGLAQVARLFDNKDLFHKSLQQIQRLAPDHPLLRSIAM